MGFTYAGYRLAQWLSATAPPVPALRLSEWIADRQWRRSAELRAAVQANRSLVLGTTTPPDAPVVRETFRHFARYLVEFFSIHRVPQPEVRLQGVEHLTNALDEGQGAIALTAHLGNWEAAAVLVRRMGIPVTAIVLPQADPRMSQLFTRQRRRCGIDVIPLGPDAARRGLQVLRDGQLLGLLGDRDFGDNGLVVPFCSGHAVLPRGPAILSLRSQAPVVPLFLVREGVWKFRLCVEPPFRPETTAVTEASVRALTHRYAATIGRYLTRFPDQWLMFQPMHARPDGDAPMGDLEDGGHSHSAMPSLHDS